MADLDHLELAVGGSDLSHFTPTRQRAPTSAPSLHTLAISLGLPTASWRSSLILHEDFCAEITRSAVPVDLRAIHQLKGSPLALDLYTWLTHRMSYLRKSTLVPWEGLQARLAAGYARPRDFRPTALARLEDVVGAYPELQIREGNEGLHLYPSPPHVESHALQQGFSRSRDPRGRTSTTPRRMPRLISRPPNPGNSARSVFGGKVGPKDGIHLYPTSSTSWRPEIGPSPGWTDSPNS